MDDDSAKTNKLSIYLIKDGYDRAEDIADLGGGSVEIPEVGTFVYRESRSHPPDWVAKFFGESLGGAIHLYAANARAVLIVPVAIEQRIVRFALAFGFGRHLLKDEVFEEHFGLKVVLNSIGEDGFRSIGKTTLGSVPKHSREQVAREVSAFEFGIDIEQDLVSSVTAKSQDPMLGNIITGRDALSISAKVDVYGIKDLLVHLHARYQSADYKTNFEFIDQIKEVRNGAREQDLVTLLVEKIKARDFGKVWMAVPEIVDWSTVKEFRYLKKKLGNQVSDLHIETFMEAWGSREITADALKGAAVFLIHANTEDEVRWPAFRCIYAEIELDGCVYILNNGKWYEIARSFTDEVLREFARFDHSTLRLPDCSFNDEGAYNSATATALGYCCMDRKLIMHGGGHSSIEFCDLLTPDNKIVHVKRYAGPGPMSHLFSQGVVSGELFVAEPEFRRKLNAKLPPNYRLPDPAVRPDPAQYEIVYAIISASQKDLDIPFFSKVSLRNAKRRLTSYGYKVSILKVQRT